MAVLNRICCHALQQWGSFFGLQARYLKPSLQQLLIIKNMLLLIWKVSSRAEIWLYWQGMSRETGILKQEDEGSFCFDLETYLNVCRNFFLFLCFFQFLLNAFKTLQLLGCILLSLFSDKANFVTEIYLSAITTADC